MPPSSLAARLVLLALLVIALVVVVTRWPAEPRIPRRRALASPAASTGRDGPTWTAHSPSPALARASFVGDGGRVGAYDAGPPAPDPGPRTGVLARTIVARLCSPASRTLCDARERLGCSSRLDRWIAGAWVPTDDCVTTLETACVDWVDRRYGGYPDAMQPDDAALERCRRALEVHARAGDPATLDAACSAEPLDRARVGEPCIVPGSSCQGGDAVCDEGYVCTIAPQRGEPCDERPCALGLVCVAGLCDAPTPHGGPCDADSICADVDEVCFEGRCVESAPLGAACDYETDCGRGARCTAGRCVAASTDACEENLDCGRSRFCEGPFEGRCEAIAGIGEPCSQDRDCTLQLACDRGLCASWEPIGPADVGERCGESTGCREGLLCSYGETGYRCMRPLPIGARCEDAPCDGDAVCAFRLVGGHCRPALCAESNPYVVDDVE